MMGHQPKPTRQQRQRLTRAGLLIGELLLAVVCLVAVTIYRAIVTPQLSSPGLTLVPAMVSGIGAVVIALMGWGERELRNRSPQPPEITPAPPLSELDRVIADNSLPLAAVVEAAEAVAIREQQPKPTQDPYKAIAEAAVERLNAPMTVAELNDWAARLATPPQQPTPADCPHDDVFTVGTYCSGYRACCKTCGATSEGDSNTHATQALRGEL